MQINFYKQILAWYLNKRLNLVRSTSTLVIITSFYKVKQCKIFLRKDFFTRYKRNQIVCHWHSWENCVRRTYGLSHRKLDKWDDIYYVNEVLLRSQTWYFFWQYYIIPYHLQEDLSFETGKILISDSHARNIAHCWNHNVRSLS